MKSIICRYLLLTLIVALCSCAKDHPLPLGQASTRGLDEIKGYSAGKNWEHLGFEEANEPAMAQTGKPMKVYYVSLSDLQGYAATINPRTLLIDIRRYLVPIVVGGAARSLVVLQWDSSGYRSVSYGGGNSARLFVPRRDQLESTSGIVTDSVFLVQIPAFNLAFVGGLDSDDSLRLLSTQASQYLLPDSTKRTFDTSTVMSGRDVFAGLVASASAHDGGAR